MKRIIVDKERLIEIDVVTRKTDRICVVLNVVKKGKVTKSILLENYSFEQIMEMAFN